MTDESRPLEPELQRIVDRTVQSLLAVFYVDGMPVFANDRRAVTEEEEARALIETAEQDGYIGPGWREDAQRWADTWVDS